MKKGIRVFTWVILGFLLLMLVVPFCIPVPPLAGALPVRQLADPDSLFISLNGMDIHYKSSGQGEPTLILLHGFASSLFSWREVFPALAKDYRVVSYDRPAFGLTERPMNWQGENPYSAESQPKLLLALMDHLGIQKAVLVGNSAGGAIAMLTAIQYPQRVQALVLVDPAVYHESGSFFKNLLFSTPQMDHLGPLLARRIQAWGRKFGELAWHDPSKITDTVWTGYTKPLQAQNWDRALWYHMAADQDLDLPNQLSRLRLPALVITGDDDRVVPTEQSIRLAGELPNARLIVIPACGHAPQEECPQAFLKALTGFLKEVGE